MGGAAPYDVHKGPLFPYPQDKINAERNPQTQN